MLIPSAKKGRGSLCTFHLHISGGTLYFNVVESAALAADAPHGVTSRDGSGNHVPERKSFPLIDHRRICPKKVVLHHSHCPALSESCHKCSLFSAFLERERQHPERRQFW